jgi:hypothetical protein
MFTRTLSRGHIITLTPPPTRYVRAKLSPTHYFYDTKGLVKIGEDAARYVGLTATGNGIPVDCEMVESKHTTGQTTESASGGFTARLIWVLGWTASFLQFAFCVLVLIVGCFNPHNFPTIDTPHRVVIGCFCCCSIASVVRGGGFVDTVVFNVAAALCLLGLFVWCAGPEEVHTVKPLGVMWGRLTDEITLLQHLSSADVAKISFLGLAALAANVFTAGHAARILWFISTCGIGVACIRSWIAHKKPNDHQPPRVHWATHVTAFIGFICSICAVALFASITTGGSATYALMFMAVLILCGYFS